jgi:hypothetical protein
MLGQFLVKRPNGRFIAAAALDAAFQIIRHGGRRYAAKVVKRAHMGLHEIVGALTWRAFGITKAAASQATHEQLNADQFTGLPVDIGQSITAVIHEEFVARLVHNRHRGLNRPMCATIAVKC